MLARSVLILTSALAVTSCGYSPNPEAGALRCGPNMSCPEGYVCSLDNACWKKDADPAKLLGCWLFDAGSMETVACSDGSTDNTDLHDIADWVEITAGTLSTLATQYYCPWKLNVSGREAVVAPSQTCTNSDDLGTTMYKYHGERFTFGLGAGGKARLDASLPYDVSTTVDGMIGSCSLKITGTLTAGNPSLCTVAAASPTEN